MKQIPNTMLSITSLLMHVLAIPVFFLCFTLIYCPEWIVNYLKTGQNQIVVFNTLMLMCIMLGVLCASRIPMVACRRHLHLNWSDYILWSLAEIVVTALFMGLYITLMSKGTRSYFPTVGHSLAILTAIITYPYIIINLLMYAIRPTSNVPVADADLIRFYDGAKRLKLIITADAILYIRAEENYVRIHYMDGERVKEYALRASMRSIEEMMHKHGIARCHRSFFVNPKHIKVLRKDKEGAILAELDTPNIKPVIVSPTYYDSLNKQL